MFDVAIHYWIGNKSGFHDAKFPKVPNVGDFIRLDDFKTLLKVTGITYHVDMKGECWTIGIHTEELIHKSKP